MCATANFESERRSFALFPKADMPASGFGGQVTLRDLIMATVLQFLRDLPNQKFAFNFPNREGFAVEIFAHYRFNF